MRKVLGLFSLALLLLILPDIACSEVIHIAHVEDSKISVNSVLVLRSQRPIDFWDLTISLPENSVLSSVRDEMGQIEYNLTGNVLSLKTNSKKSNIRVVNLTYTIPEIKETQGLYYIQLNLFGFVNDTTYVQIKQPLPYIFVLNAQTEYEINETNAKTTGPVNLMLAYGGDKESEHYFTSSDIDLEKLENLYPIIEGVTGIKSPVKFGVAVVPEEEYTDDYIDWSAGTFNGLIVLKESKNENEILATAIHETVHGFNQFAVDWDQTNISWFDEGTASYIGSAAYRILGEQQPELFGEKKVWRNNTYIYTLPPKKTPEELLTYYQTNRNFMYYWYPQSAYDREFGYAYSELFIREYVKDYGNELQKVYRQLLEINQTVYDRDEANKIILDIMDTDFKPCYSLKLKEIENCTTILNKMSFKIPSAGGKEIGQFVEEPEIPKPEPNQYLSYFREIFQNLIDSLSQIFSFFAGIFQ